MTHSTAMPAEEQKNMTKLEKALSATSPSKLIVLKYDRALSALHTSLTAIDENNIEKRCNAVTEAIEVISDLYLTLNRQQGGDLAENLGTIYSYMIWRLPKINFKNDKATAHEIIGLLKQLRTSWVKVDRQIMDQVAATEKNATSIATTTKANQNKPSVA